MTKSFFLTALIIIASSSWLYLDYLNKQETQAINEMRKEMQMSHERSVASMKKMVEFNSQAESAMVGELNKCYSDADKANFDYIADLKKSTGRKSNAIVISRADLDQAASLLEAAKQRCRKMYDFQLKMKKAIQ